MGSALKKDPEQYGWIQEIGRLVSGITGVRLGAKQSAMLQTRLSRRILELGFTSPEKYLEYVRNNLIEEVPKLVALLTTHHTYFFREFSQFQFLEEKGLPHLIPMVSRRGDNTLRVWSAGCSFGQEVYSLAMFLDHHLRNLASQMKFEILGTDVDPDSIAKARNGVYLWKDIKQIPLNYLWTHWVRGTEDIADFAKAKPSLKATCRFEIANLLDLNGQDPREKFDLIFCRNVLIYFKPEQVAQVSFDLVHHLNPGGLLFTGLSESLVGNGLALESFAPSVYTTPTAKPPSAGVPVPTAHVELAARATETTRAEVGSGHRLRVFCVDDSTTILSMLRKILEPEFEIVGTARDGIEAAEKLKTLTCDVMTLDIHMPRQNGIEFLQRTDLAYRPPTIILSSVPREDSSQALKCLELGAKDYVEKPDIYSLEFRADEIRSKIRCALVPTSGLIHRAVLNERGLESKAPLSSPDQKLRVIVAGGADRLKVASLLEEFTGIQPPTVILLEGSTGLIPALSDSFTQSTGKKCTVLEGSVRDLETGNIYLGDFSSLAPSLGTFATGKRVSLIVMGSITETMFRRIDVFAEVHILLEDLDVTLPRPHALVAKAARVAPYTSLAYHSNNYLSGS